MTFRIILPTANHTHTIIFLHGRDSTASECVEDIFDTHASDGRPLKEIFPSLKWIFPEAGILQSARFGCAMSQWFDIWSIERPCEKDELQSTGLRQSVNSIQDLVVQELASIPASNMILGGVSQGCVAAIMTLLCSGIGLGGFVGFNSWLSPYATAVSFDTNRFRKLLGMPQISQEPVDSRVVSTPIFLAHNKDDNVVPYHNGQLLGQNLANMGFTVEWRSYEDGGHWINEPAGIEDTVLFLRLHVGLLAEPN